MTTALREHARALVAISAVSVLAPLLLLMHAAAQDTTPNPPAEAESAPTPQDQPRTAEPKEAPNNPAANAVVELPTVTVVIEKQPKPNKKAKRSTAKKPSSELTTAATNIEGDPNEAGVAGGALATRSGAASQSTIDNGGTGGNPEVDYALPNAATGTKTMTPIMETPFTVDTVPQAVIEDQQIVRLEEALENVPGVRRIAQNANLNDEFLLRGFGTTTTYRDGVRENARGHSDFANIERVEVLKGPGSILYGRAEPGGIINLVTKKPQQAQRSVAQQQVGLWNFYRTTIDATGPFGIDKSLLYRLNVAYEDAGSFRDWEDSDRFFVAPVVRWNVSDQTQINFEFEYLNDHETPIPRLPELYGGREIGGIAPVSRSTNLGDPLAFHDADRMLAGVNWFHAFDSNWTLYHRFTAQFEDIASYNFYITSPADPNYVDETIFLRGLQDVRRNTDSYFNSVYLVGRIETQPARHTLVVGGDHFVEKDTIPRLMDIPEGDPALNIDIYNPRALPARPFIDPATNRSPNTDTTWYGIYIQDQIELPYDFFLLAGVRYDNATTDFNVERQGITTLSAASHNQKYTPRYGLLWRPIQELSVYGSYTENFGRPNETDEDVGPLPPELADQWEAGVKTELGRFWASLAWFELTKMNIAAEDEDGNTIVVGEATARGIETEVAGEVYPGLRVIGGYAYMPFADVTKDSRIIFDDDGNPLGAGPGLTGNRLFAVPIHQGSRWGTYEFTHGNFKGLKLGAGIVAAGDVFNDLDNTIVLPSYWTLKLSAGYEFVIDKTKYTAQLNIDNVTDATYFNYGAQYGAPRSFRAALTAAY